MGSGKFTPTVISLPCMRMLMSNLGKMLKPLLIAWLSRFLLSVHCLAVNQLGPCSTETVVVANKLYDLLLERESNVFCVIVYRKCSQQQPVILDRMSFLFNPNKEQCY